MRILVIDASEENAALTQELLSILGHHASCAGTATLALQLMAASKWDAMLVDLDLPEGWGCVLAEAVRCRRGGSIVLIGLSNWGGTRSGRLAPFDDVMYKTLDLDRLVELLRSHEKSSKSTIRGAS